MPTIVNRDEHEARLARIVARLTSGQKQRVIDAMGTPPNVANVPDSLWRELEREQQQATSGYLSGLFLLSSAGIAAWLIRNHRYATPPDFIRDEAEKWGEAAASELASGTIANTRARLTKAVDEYRAKSGPIDAEFTVTTREPVGLLPAPTAKAEVDPRPAQKEFDERIESIFGPDRAARIAKTETTRAQTAGRGPVKESFERDTGGRMLGIWRHRGPKEKGTHPCPLCAPLVGTSETEWGRIDPEAAIGPPRHPQCDCQIEEMVITRAEFKRQSWEAPRGSDLELADYERAWMRIMHSLSPRDR